MRRWMLVLSLALPVAAHAQAPDGKAAFERMKGLVGSWRGTAASQHGAPAGVRYELRSNGSVVVELLFPDTDHEMRTAYTLDRGELVATHYCAMANQPRFRLAAADAKQLSFAFDGGTNFDPATDTHIHSGRIRFPESDRLEAEWDVHQGGKQTQTNRLFLTRVK